MNIEKIRKAGINYDKGLKRMNGKVALYEKLLNYFLIDNNYEVFLKSLEIKNYEEAFEAIHTIKGIVGNLEMNILYDKVAPLSDALKYHEYDQISSLLLPFQESYEKMIIELKEALTVE